MENLFTHPVFQFKKHFSDKGLLSKEERGDAQPQQTACQHNCVIDVCVT